MELATSQELATPQEKLLFKWLFALACVMWVFLIVGTLGIGLIYVLLFGLIYLFTHSALIAHLKGNSVRITEEQFPDLHKRLVTACEKLKMPVPEAYIINGNGLLNAFATKFLGRSYVALYSDVIDSFKEDDDAIDFYIGHELGHIHRKHLRWWPILIPTSMFPLLFPAYRRACELTCDQYGRFCCGSDDAAVRGLSLLAAGKTRWKKMSAASYTAQIKETGGFWMSFHEITASYPWLAKRVSKMHNPAGAEMGWPQRHPLSWILGMFTPGFMSGAFIPIVIIYIGIIGVVVALPNIQKFKKMSTAAAEHAMWKNPRNGKKIFLPRGFQVTKTESKSDVIVGTFTTDPDHSLEQLLVETAGRDMELKEYVTLLHEAKTRAVGENIQISEPRYSKIAGVDVVTFGFKTTSSGIEFENIFRIWAHDKRTFWQEISTIATGDDSRYQDSEALSEAFIEGTK